MIELPEAVVMAGQVNETLSGKRIVNVIAAHTPHKWAWYHGDPHGYQDLLEGKKVGRAAGVGALIEIRVDDTVMLFGDGVNLRYHRENEARPPKHQFLAEFDDFTALSASVQMYGGLWCFLEGQFDNKYFLQAKVKPSPLTEKFDMAYFEKIVSAPEAEGFSAKALLATEQRIPGLGNGVLQDILFNARIHPKKKVKAFSGDDIANLCDSIKSTFAEMMLSGGRDTEKDLFGCPGGYRTKLSRNTAGKPCPVCGDIIRKEAYMGGSVYYCPTCQKL